MTIRYVGDMEVPAQYPALFNFDGYEVRTVTIAGDPWWVAADVAAVLDIGRTSDAIRGLDEDEKGAVTIRTPGGPQSLSVVNEFGLFSLILRSRKPDAQRFKRWVTHEVLPAIRKTGSYSVARPAASGITVDLRDRGQMAEILVQALQIAEEERARADREHERADAAEAAVEAQRPDVEFVERFVDSDSLFGIREAAKTLGVNERDLIAWMEAKSYVTRLRGRIMPSHIGKERGYVVSKIEEWRNADGDMKAKPRAWITTKGMDHFGKKYDGPRKQQLALAVVR